MNEKNAFYSSPTIFNKNQFSIIYWSDTCKKSRADSNSGSLFISGNRSRHEDEACRHHFFTGKEPLQYFLADERSIECPFHGKFVANPQNTNTAMGNILIHYKNISSILL